MVNLGLSRVDDAVVAKHPGMGHPAWASWWAWAAGCAQAPGPHGAGRVRRLPVERLREGHCQLCHRHRRGLGPADVHSEEDEVPLPVERPGGRGRRLRGQLLGDPSGDPEVQRPLALPGDGEAPRRRGRRHFLEKEWVQQMELGALSAHLGERQPDAGDLGPESSRTQPSAPRTPGWPSPLQRSCPHPGGRVVRGLSTRRGADPPFLGPIPHSQGVRCCWARGTNKHLSSCRVLQRLGSKSRKKLRDRCHLSAHTADTGALRQFLTLNPRIRHAHRPWKAVRPLHGGWGGGLFPFMDEQTTRYTANSTWSPEEGQDMAMPTTLRPKHRCQMKSLLSRGGGRPSQLPRALSSQKGS